MAAQYYLITRLLLIAHQPELPRVGPQRLKLARRNEDEIRQAVRKLCGVALSNPETEPALLVACQGISLCGDYLLDAKEQEAVVHLLKKAEAETAWPTANLLDSLRSTWSQKS